MSRSDLGNKLLHHGATERIVILPNHYERAGAADDVVTVAFLDASRGLGVSPIWARFDFGQAQKAVNKNAFPNCLTTQKLRHRTSIFGAIAGRINGVGFGVERRCGEPSRRKIDGGTNRGAVVERSWGLGDQAAEA